jgi:hypothetical protein
MDEGDLWVKVAYEGWTGELIKGEAIWKGGGGGWGKSGGLTGDRVWSDGEGYELWGVEGECNGLSGKEVYGRLTWVG